MGICFSSTCSSPSSNDDHGVNHESTPTTSTDQFSTSSSSVVARVVSQSQTATSSSSGSSSTITTTTTNSSVSGNSGFSGAGGDHDSFSSSPGKMLPHPNLRIFTFSELKTATRGFRNDTVLGEGGFGKVYKGRLLDHHQSSLIITKTTNSVTTTNNNGSGSGSFIAVKKLNSESLQGFKEWQSEVNFLGRLSHPNLVKLLGYCWEDTELLLVYEFMQKGSLENHLFGRGSAVQPLPWDIRLKILIGAASGLAFLHAADRKVIYRDFKASNILLDASYHSKLSDFGLAKMGPTESRSHVTTQVMGTYGYAAPEYVATGHLYVKSDVYCFGVVLVEMLTGLRALDTTRPSGQHNLVDWIKPHLYDRRKLKHVMDPRLEGRYPSRSALQIAQVALNCLENEPKNRPSMQEVVETLEKVDSANERHRQSTTSRVHSSSTTTSSNYQQAAAAHRRSQQQQHMQYRSPLHPKQLEVNRAYPLPPVRN